MTKGCIYYTDNSLDPKILRVCQEQLIKSFNGEISSVSLKPINFGRNIVLKNRTRSYLTMITQILMALEAAKTDVVFFTEHDILYHPSHFEIYPERDDLYYYNESHWRWLYGTDTAITFDGLSTLSGMCCNRELAIRHYKYRIKIIKEKKLYKIKGRREPRWLRIMGYEPGTKRKRCGGITNESHAKWKSKYPNIDIRHKNTFTYPRVKLKSFKRKRSNWVEKRIDEIEGWDLRKMFNL